MKLHEFEHVEDNDEWMLAEDIPDCDLFFSQIWLSSFVNEMENTVGTNYKKVMSVYDGMNLKFYYGKQDSQRFSNHVMNLIHQNPDFGHEINTKIYEHSDNLVEFAEKVEKTSLKELSREQLWNLYDEHDQIHTNLYEYGWLPNVIDMFHANFTEKLKSYLREILDNEKEINETLVKLTVPNEKSVINIETENFLKICLKVQKDKEQKNLFKNKEINTVIKDMNDEVRNSILDHYAKYHHLKYNFIGNHGVYTFEDYVKQIKDIIESDVDVEKRLEEEKSKVKEEKQEKQRLMKELDIDEHHEELFNLWGDFMLTKIYRRNSQIKDLYVMERVLKEIATRLDLKLDHVRFMLPKEVKDALLNDNYDKEILDKRLESCVYYAEKGKEKIFIGEEAEKLKSQIKEQDYSKIKKIEGQCACVGKAKGRVKIIIRPKDMEKMNQGDILVSIATDPDIVPAMQKASAIVTEQGGVTSHAAIVSREMRTPCLIGTKIATKVFKDNDLVEVDATKGVIKKLEEDD